MEVRWIHTFAMPRRGTQIQIGTWCRFVNFRYHLGLTQRPKCWPACNEPVLDLEPQAL
jgi:hypothetical protein